LEIALSLTESPVDNQNLTFIANPQSLAGMPRLQIHFGPGKQRGMKSIRLRGAIKIDPYRDDFIKVLIEQRQANASDKAIKHALEVIANATAYGSFVELNEQREPHYVYRNVKGQNRK
jgi:hypothetical protein